MQRWLNFAVSGNCDWPDSRLEFDFDAARIVLLPPTEDYSASIHTPMRTPTGIEEVSVVNQFLSLACWTYRGRLTNEMGWGGNPNPVPIPRQPMGWTINRCFKRSWMPLAEPRQRLALALYREAMALNSVPYQFLGFFKIVNVIRNGGQAQKSWIRQALPSLTGGDVRSRVAILAKRGDAAEHLYVSGRCAVAHAFSDPIIDPDNLEDLRRLSDDLSVVRALAEHAIEFELGVARSTV